MIGGGLVVLLVSVLTTCYIPSLLTNKNMLPYTIRLCNYLHEELYLWYIYITLQENYMIMIIELHLVMLTYYA